MTTFVNVLKRSGFPLAAALAFCTVGMAAADSRPAHYESRAPANVKEAQTSLTEAVGDITKAWAAHDFDEVHKISYTIEKAANVLANAPNADPALSERLAHTVEIVHLASEIKSGKILAVAVSELDGLSRKTLTVKD